MISRIAEALRDEHRRAEARLTPRERLALAQRLGDEAAAAFSTAHGVTVEQAAREFARRRKAGRRPSRCAAEP